MNDNIKEMENSNIKKRAKKLRRKYNKLVFIIGLTAVICIVSTYAWFIGINVVSVQPIELSIKVSEGLLISTTAKDSASFTNTIDLDLENLVGTKLTNYTTNKNAVPGENGLKPISSVGKMDTTNSVLELYSKTSMTSTDGGYRIRANKIDNATTEGAGYLAFDLFFKNASGNTYRSDYDRSEDEGIYLNTSSSVTMSSSGTGGDGMENAVRVAFMQIGRVDHKTGYGNVAQGITCTSSDTVTGLCNVGADDTHPLGRGATFNIWEPNDTVHTADAVSHFSTICKKRGATGDYTGEVCDAFTTSQYVTTYALNNAIASSENVDVYDGLNGYTQSKFTAMEYYTDTNKNADADTKTEFFYLAPNSITKVRVYLYLEGQDVDNYDLTSYGKTLKIQFSFSKNKISE